MSAKVAVVSALVVVACLALAGCEGGSSPDPDRTTPSPALVAVDGIEGLPDTVAELPVTDADAFRGLLGRLRGTPVVVNLWASWCEPCEREMPRLSEAALEHPEVQFLGVDTLDARDGAEEFIAEYDVPFPSLFDPDGAIRTDLGSFGGLPVTAFVDADGAMTVVDGELSDAALEERLGAIVG